MKRERALVVIVASLSAQVEAQHEECIVIIMRDI